MVGTCCNEQNSSCVCPGPLTVNRVCCQRAMRHSKERRGFVRSKTAWATEWVARKQRLLHSVLQTRACGDLPCRSQTRTCPNGSRKDGPLIVLGCFHFDHGVLAGTRKLRTASKRGSDPNSFQIQRFQFKGR